MKPYRYPGPQPFSEQQQHIFFGREQELNELLRLVRREQWVVLYGKSGLGKSSLLNAGLTPRLVQDDHALPIFIRFHAWTSERKDTPLSISCDLLKSEIKQTIPWFERLAEDDHSLWRYLKSMQLAQAESTEAELPNFVFLVFDQFEELFTFPASEVEAFAKGLAEVFYSNIPERYRAKLEKFPDLLSASELRKLHEPLSLRVINAIRTDRMALMHQLKPFLPGTLDYCYELRPLSIASAEEAVLNPAYDPRTFVTPRFDYEDDAIDALLEFLSSGKKQDIESFQLQIMCEHLEKHVVERAGRRRIVVEDLADPAEILENYYLDKIAEIDSTENRLAARKLIEEGLIFAEEERRLTLFEGQILKAWGVDGNLLARLEDTHLLRREPSLRGGYTYELSHDTLVAPVLKAKEKRRSEERRAELEAEKARKNAEMQALRAEAELEKRRAEEAERLKNEAEKGQKRARVFARLAGVVAAFAIAAMFWALAAQVKANEERAKSEANEQKIQKALREITEANNARLKVEIGKYVTAAERMLKSGDKEKAKEILIEAMKLDSLKQNPDLERLLNEINKEK
jgi:hypothetical protein